MGSDIAGALTKAGATMAKQKAKRRTIDFTSMAPLPVVKPIEYAKLLKALEAFMNVTCS